MTMKVRIALSYSYNSHYLGKNGEASNLIEDDQSTSAGEGHEYPLFDSRVLNLLSAISYN